jgi:SAM-dependent methyltransferase
MKRASFMIAVLVLLPALAGAQDYEPSVGQEGKDVIWVPTPEDLVEAMLDIAKVTPNDFVMDLGSGDGRVVIAAAKRGARAVGVEYNPDMVALSRRNAEKAGVSAKATFLNADLFATDLSKATVVTMYLLPSLNLKLRPTILDLKPGIRVVSHAFNMGDWEPDQTVEKQGRTAYLWIVPAKVEGTWSWPSNPGTTQLKLTQTFQKIQGTLRAGGKVQSISDGKLDGDHIVFSCGGQEYSGRVHAKMIEGTVKTGTRQEPWSASLP